MDVAPEDEVDLVLEEDVFDVGLEPRDIVTVGVINNTILRIRIPIET